MYLNRRVFVMVLPYVRRILEQVTRLCRPITKTCLYNVDPLKSNFYIVKLGFTGLYIMFLISAQKHTLWVLVRTASPTAFEQKYEKYQKFYLKFFISLVVKFSAYLNRHVFVMPRSILGGLKKKVNRITHSVP